MHEPSDPGRDPRRAYQSATVNQAGPGDAHGRRYIDGIFHFCDRWCARCPLTDRCKLHAVQRAVFDTPRCLDPETPAFWETLALCLTQTDILLETLVRERDTEGAGAICGPQSPDGVLGSLTLRLLGVPTGATTEVLEARPGDGPDADPEDPLIEDAVEYARYAHGALDDLPPASQDDGPPVTDGRRSWCEAAETIRWDCCVIHAKITTALVSDTWSAPADEPLVDGLAIGSAKVALLAIDRSLSAWGQLGELIGERRTAPAKDRLRRLRGAVETAFPLARLFRRPGFETDRPARPHVDVGAARGGVQRPAGSPGSER
jgi:hypothetical protein